MKYLLSLLLVLSGCSSKQDVSSTHYLELYKEHEPKHKACRKFLKTVVIPPVTELGDSAFDDEFFIFIRDEKKALDYISKFSTSELTFAENLKEYNSVIRGCVEKTDPVHQPCHSSVETYKFFRALIYGMSQFGWSDGTVEQAKSLTLRYLNYVGHSNASFMDIINANDLLMRLAARNYVNKNLFQKTYELNVKGEAHFETLKEEGKKFAKKKLECQDATKFYNLERKKIEEYSKEFLLLLLEV